MKLSPASENLYNYWQGRFNDWRSGRPVTLETGEAFLAFLEDAGCRPNTIGCAGRALRRLGLDVPVPTMEWREPKYLELEQVKQLINAAESLLVRTITIVTFSSACRISEILNLELADLELDEGVATVSRKGGRRERVALGKQGSEALREWLRQRQSRSKRVFMDYTYNDVYHLLKQAARKAGIPEFTPHYLRHSRIMHLRQAGREWADISEVAGHTKVETTIKIYGRRKAEQRTQLLVDF